MSDVSSLTCSAFDFMFSGRSGWDLSGSVSEKVYAAERWVPKREVDDSCMDIYKSHVSHDNTRSNGLGFSRLTCLVFEFTVSGRPAWLIVFWFGFRASRLARKSSGRFG